MCSNEQQDATARVRRSLAADGVCADADLGVNHFDSGDGHGQVAVCAGAIVAAQAGGSLHIWNHLSHQLHDEKTMVSAGLTIKGNIKGHPVFCIL